MHEERNMIIPFGIALELLVSMKLPVYSGDNGGFKCHFRDVVKRLARDVLESVNPNYNPKGISVKHLKILDRQWCSKYYDLKSRRVMAGYDSGKLFAGLFIAKNIEIAHTIRKYYKQETDIK